MNDKTNSIFTEIEINASSEQVWNVLTDWSKLSDWSSSFQGISTDGLVKGERSTSYFKNPITGGVLEFEHEVTDYEKGVKFGWYGVIAGNVKDHHIYSIEATATGNTIFRQEDGFHSKNSHSSIMKFMLKHNISSAYKKFNTE
ncbi:MAG: SRPBCC family protein [Saprospiraceae bacterium]